jgi:hypothetical protein
MVYKSYVKQNIIVGADVAMLRETDGIREVSVSEPFPFLTKMATTPR